MRGKGMGSVPFPSRLGGMGECCKLPQWGPQQKTSFGVFYSLKTHLIDTIISFLTFLGDLAGRIEMPGGPDCGQQAICWTLLF